MRRWGAGAGGDGGSDGLLRVLPRRRAGRTSTGDTTSPRTPLSEVLGMPASHLSSQSNPKLLTLMRSKLRLGHYSRRTEQAYVGWVIRFVRHHRLRHPAELVENDVMAFHRYLAEERRVRGRRWRRSCSCVGRSWVGHSGWRDSCRGHGHRRGCRWY